MIKVRHILTGQTETLHKLFKVTDINAPLMLSVPHSGPFVLDEFADRFNYGPGFWVDVDLYTDEVYPIDLGSSLVALLAPQQANVNRSWLRWLETGQNDPIDMRSLLEGEVILRRPYNASERGMLHGLWDGYHGTLMRLRDRMFERYGYVLLIDCHSLNSRALANVPDAGRGIERADFVIGSLDDTFADLRVIDMFDRALRDAAAPYGLRVVRNDPYKGGYITQAYHDPARRVHVLQLEIKKAMYMHEGLDGEECAFERNSTFVRTAQILRVAFERTRDEVYELLGR